MGPLKLIDEKQSFFPRTDDEAMAWLDSHAYTHRHLILEKHSEAP